MSVSQILPPLHPRRQPYARCFGPRGWRPESGSTAFIASRLLDDLIDPALLHGECRTHPDAAAALHALPSVTAQLCGALGIGTLEAPLEEALLQRWTHPGQWLEEVVRAGAVDGRWG